MEAIVPNRATGRSARRSVRDRRASLHSEARFRRQNRRGSTMIEFALTAPLLMLLAAGVLNYGMALRSAIAVAAAARAGAQYGSASAANAADIAGMQAAAANAAPNLSGMVVTPVQVCRCSNGSAVSCTGTCGSGAVAMYVEVTARATAPHLFRYTGLPFSGAVASKAVMRAR